MKLNSNWTRNAQVAVVLPCAAALKQYYSAANVDQLRWILAPTTLLVELVTGRRFEFESHAGYIDTNRTFLIAASCAGVNFLITAFLMLSLRKMWRTRPHEKTWRFIPIAALVAYFSALVANTFRISTALQLQVARSPMGWLTANQLHRFEGIFIYFGFLLLLFIVSEKISYRVERVGDRSSLNYGTASGSDQSSLKKDTASDSPYRRGLFRQSLFPLLIYYATTLGIPLVNGAYRQGAEFWEHSLFVLLTPLLLILPFATFRFMKARLHQIGDCTVSWRCRDRP